MEHLDIDKVIKTQAYLLFKKVRSSAAEVIYKDNFPMVENVCSLYNLHSHIEHLKDDRYLLHLAVTSDMLDVMKAVWHRKDKDADFIKGALFGYDIEDCCHRYLNYYYETEAEHA
jgi:hypothetical protein